MPPRLRFSEVKIKTNKSAFLRLGGCNRNRFTSRLPRQSSLTPAFLILADLGRDWHIARKVVQRSERLSKCGVRVRPSNKIGELLTHRPRFVDLNGEFQVELQGWTTGLFGYIQEEMRTRGQRTCANAKRHLNLNPLIHVLCWCQIRPCIWKGWPEKYYVFLCLSSSLIKIIILLKERTGCFAAC